MRWFVFLLAERRAESPEGRAESRAAARRGQPAALVALIGLLIGGAAVGCGGDEPDEATARLLSASQQALQQGDARRALALADSAAARRPGSADAHFQRGRVFSRLRRFEAADRAYRKALDRDPDYPGAWLNLGNNASRRQEHRRALRFYRKEKAHPARAAVYTGRAYASLGKLDSARQAYRRALEGGDPENAHLAHAWLSDLYETNGRLDSALAHARRAVKLRPDNADYAYILGKQLMSAGRPGAAAETLRTVAQKKPWHHGAHQNLGRALMRQGKKEEAQRYLTAADSLQQLQGEIRRLKNQIQTTPNDPRSWLRLSKKLKQAGRRKEAARAYRTAQSVARRRSQQRLPSQDLLSQDSLSQDPPSQEK